MSKHFNNLTPAEAERLSLLLEECGEVIQIIGKIQRHGYESYHPKNKTQSNRMLLEKELGDVQAAAKMMFKSKDIDLDHIKEHADKKEKAVKKYLHHQEEK